MIVAMKRWILGFLLILTLTQRNQAAEVDLDGHDGRRGNVRLKIGDTLQVTLPSNPTTGYTWTDDWSCNGILKSRGEKQYQPFKREKHLVGGGGVEIFKYLVIGRGTTTLSFSYVRPWERAVSPMGMATWKIIVE